MIKRTDDFFHSENKTAYQGTYSYLKVSLHAKCLVWSDAKYKRELIYQWKQKSYMNNYNSITLVKAIEQFRKGAIEI